MNVESLREYCLSLPLATEDFPFDETTLVFREEHPEISGAWHMNKKYWNQVNLSGHLEDELVQGLVRHSYAEVVKKLTRKERAEHEEITTVRE